MLINSSVRGPYPPPSVRGMVHWTDPFLSRITQDIKLVGPTINCEGTVSMDGRPIKHPHVQSYAIATDRKGFEVILDSGALACHGSRRSAILKGELAISRAILNAGYSFGSFLARYQVWSF